jgi:hypothetical protein
MVYVPGKSINVIDSNKLEIAGYIKNDEIFEEGGDIWNVHIFQAAASPDGKYVYLAVNYQEVSDSKGYDEYIYKSKIFQLDASKQKVLTWANLKNGIIVKHLEVSPDTRVYASYQKTSWGGEYAGFYVLDFDKEKIWDTTLEPSGRLINDFAFSEDGKQIYMNGFGTQPNLTELNWTKNMIYTTWIKTNNKNYPGYVRSVATGKGQVYVNVHKAKEIIVINNKTGTKQSLAIDYEPFIFKTSPNRETLYTLGTISSEGKSTYLLHKYTNLKYLDAESGTITNPSDFYKGFSVATMTYPSGVRPSNMEISPDEKWAFITTAKGGNYGETGGTELLIYNLDKMTEFKRISIPSSGWEISIANEKINYTPLLKLDLTVAIPNSVFNSIKKFEVLEVFPKEDLFIQDFDKNALIVTATFTKNIDKTTINNSTFKITQINGEEIKGNITIIDNKIIFESNSPLEYGKEYQAFISNSIKSKLGEKLDKSITWSFNTKLNYNISQKPITILPAIKISDLLQNIVTNETNNTDNNTNNGTEDNNFLETESNQNNSNTTIKENETNINSNVKDNNDSNTNQKSDQNINTNKNDENKIQNNNNIDSNTTNNNNKQTDLLKSFIDWILSFFK